jgi:hypothetical protein
MHQLLVQRRQNPQFYLQRQRSGALGWSETVSAHVPEKGCLLDTVFLSVGISNADTLRLELHAKVINLFPAFFNISEY